MEDRISRSSYVEQIGNMAKSGIVFSSGFFGFFAHAGFLSALRDLGITASGYAGTSSGAIVAAMAACHMSDRAIKEILFNLKKSDFWDPDPMPFILKRALKLFRGYAGYLRGERFGRLLDKIPVERIEDCPTPLIIGVVNLTLQREELLTRGNLRKGIQASGAMPMLFKPVEIKGSLYADGGMANKAPVRALADLIRPDEIIVHYIASDNIGNKANSFLKRRMTPWHIHLLTVNISRQESYRMQCEAVRQQGIRIIEVKTDPPHVGPNSLEKGPLAYIRAREEA